MPTAYLHNIIYVLYLLFCFYLYCFQLFEPCDKIVLLFFFFWSVVTHLPNLYFQIISDITHIRYTTTTRVLYSWVHVVHTLYRKTYIGNIKKTEEFEVVYLRNWASGPNAYYLRVIYQYQILNIEGVFSFYILLDFL